MLLWRKLRNERRAMSASIFHRCCSALISWQFWLQKGANFAFIAPNAGEIPTFLSDPSDLKVLKSFRLHLGIFFFFSRTLNCWLSVILARSHAQLCNIKTGTKHKSTYLRFAQSKRWQLLCRGLRCRIKEPLWGIFILAAFPGCVWSCAKTYGTITCFVMSSQHQHLFLASLVIQNVRNSEFEISAERRSFTLCIAKQSQHVGHLIFQL